MDSVRVTRALLSVSDKTGVLDLAKCLASHGVELISTGGTARALREAGLKVLDASEVTGHPECFDGRVKTMHPKILGGVLARRDVPKHAEQMVELGIQPIDLVVANLYPFEATVAKGADFPTCVENIDIGGPTMMRSAAKNHAAVAVLTDAAQYGALIDELNTLGGQTSHAMRKRLAAAAFAHTAAYDTAVAAWFAEQTDGAGGEAAAAKPLVRTYEPAFPLKYGCNPSQKPASIMRIKGHDLPFRVMNGKPGYINLMDAVNAFKLVVEASAVLSLPAAASFKHVSPAGAAVASPLTPLEELAYEIGDRKLTPVALAYVRARHADPLCSFGDFAAVSHVVDGDTARFLKTEVSDGIIAPGYTEEALAILCSKKSGKFIVLHGNPDCVTPDMEYREIGGAVFCQKRNDTTISPEMLTHNPPVTARKELPASAMRDLVLASVACKYTQSNSVVYAVNGMTVGVGAGQQSRVDCVKLAGRKVDTWYMRQHPKVLGLKFKKGVKRQDRINARVAYIAGNMSPIEHAAWSAKLDIVPEDLTDAEKAAFMRTLTGVSLSSDAFFPFRDSIDACSSHGVQYLVEPGGSVGDKNAIEACDSYGMTMSFTGVRLFHH